MSSFPVLLVEDKDSLRAMLRHALEGQGHEVVEARDAPDALQALRQARPAVVLTDLNLDREMLTQRGSSAFLEVDGGIDRNTIAKVWNAGADTFVAGNAIFGAKNPRGEIGELRARCTAQA